MRISKILKLCTMPLCYITLSVLSCFVVGKTSNYDLDRIAYQINDYNKISPDYVSGKYPFLKLSALEEKEKSQQFNSLYKSTYYDQDNNGIRQYVDSKCIFKQEGYESISISMNTQQTFSIRPTKESDGGYYLDFGLFYTYYSDDILGPGGYHSTRFGCDSFIYISDYFADVLVERYHLESEQDPYKALIQNEDTAKISILIDETIHSFCINNILYSDKRTAPRVAYFNPYFTLFYQYPGRFNDVKFAFDIDLKKSPYCMTTTFKKITALGYTTQKYNHMFYSYNSANNSYYLNAQVTEDFLKVDSANDLIFYGIFIGVIVCGTLLFYFLIEKKKFDQGYVFPMLLIILCFLIIASTITTFIYTYMLFYVSPLYFFMVYLILRWEDIKNDTKKIVFEHKR